MKNFKYIAFSFLLTGSAVLTGCFKGDKTKCDKLSYSA